VQKCFEYQIVLLQNQLANVISFTENDWSKAEKASHNKRPIKGVNKELFNYCFINEPIDQLQDMQIQVCETSFGISNDLL